MKYWINTASKDHVMIGKVNGIVQASHGKLSPLKRLMTGDKIVYYSPKTSYENGEPLKAFTAVAEITGEQIYQAEISEDFKPYRINAAYEEFSEVEIKPLIEELSFIRNKKSWGYMFRLGLFEINEHDFNLIYSQMKIRHE